MLTRQLISSSANKCVANKAIVEVTARFERRYFDKHSQCLKKIKGAMHTLTTQKQIREERLRRGDTGAAQQGTRWILNRLIMRLCVVCRSVRDIHMTANFTMPPVRATMLVISPP